jgi:hypothetical protein
VSSITYLLSSLLDIVYPFVLIKMDDETKVVITKVEDIDVALHNCSTYTSGSEK